MTQTLTASILLAKNGYTTTDLAATTVETIMEDALDYIENEAETGMPSLTGTAGSKQVILSRRQNAAFSPLMSCMLRDAKKSALSNSTSTGNTSSTAKSIGVGSVSVSESGSVSSAISAASSLNNANDFTRELFWKAIQRLRDVEGEMQIMKG